MSKPYYDLMVLGGGSGGLNVAGAAAAVGAKVALVERFRLGGECTFTACVPSKGLIEAARIAHQARLAGGFGIRIPPPEVDFPAVMARVRSVVDGFAGSDSDEVMRARGIEVIHGSPRFTAYDTVEVDGVPVHARRFVIATGSRPAVPAIPGLAEVGYLDNVSIWDLTQVPRELVVLGGGASGIEFGQSLARLGARVTILQSGPRLMPREDAEAGERLQAALEREGLRILTRADVLGVERRDGRIRLRLQAGPLGARADLETEAILVATGRLANVEGLNLEAIGIATDPVGGIPVDDSLRTSAPNVWAVGDVIGRERFTHAAERQAAVAFQNAVLRVPKRYDATAIPRSLFSDPELASVGLTEAQALAASPGARVFRVEMADIDRARIDGQTEGFAKVFATASGRVLGAVILGPQASLVIHEFAIAMERGLTLGHLAEIVHVYPTVAGLVRKLGNQFSATRLDRPSVQRALRWVYGFDPVPRPSGSADGEGPRAG